MADLTNLLQQFTSGGTSAQKMRDVADAASARKQELSGVTQQDFDNAAIIGRYGNGGATATPAEQALQDTPLNMLFDHGVAKGMQMIEGTLAADSRLSQLENSQRSGLRAVTDTLTDVASGAGNAVAGLGALALGTASPNLGGAAAQSIDAANKMIQGTQSDALNDRRTIAAARKALSNRDTSAQREQEGGGFMADLRKIGRDTMNAFDIATDDSMSLTSGVAQGLGSLLAAGPIAKGASIAAGANTAALPLTIGAMEAGGAYQQTYNKAMEGLAQRTDLTPQEKINLANKTALDAAAWTAPTAIAAGKMVEGFAANPFALSSLRGAGINSAKETLEEGIQGGVGALGGNIALKQNVNANQDLTEGVGENIGEGALYGLGSAALTSGPGALAIGAGQAAMATGETAMRIANKTLGAVSRAVDKKAKQAEVKNDAASPLSAAKVADSVDTVLSNQEGLSTEFTAATEPTKQDSKPMAEAKAAAREQFDTYMAYMRVTPEEAKHPLMLNVVDEVGSAKNRPEAILNIANSIRNDSDLESQITKALAMAALIDSTQLGNNALEGVDMALLPNDVAEVMESMGKIQESVQSSPEVMRAFQIAGKYFQTEDGQKALQNLNQTAESAIKVALAAQVAPEQVSPEVAGVVLKMAKDGKVSLTPAQEAAITNARNVMLAARKYDAASLEAGARPLNIVSRQVKTDDDAGRDTSDRRSALQWGQRITDFIRQGKLKDAKAALEDFGMFALGQMNKVLATNQSIEAGGGIATAVKPMVRSASGKMRESKVAVGVTPTSAGSVRTVQMIAAEARFLADVHNGMAEAYPQLGVKPLAAPALDERLTGKPTEVAAAFTSGQRKAGPVQQAPAEVATESVAEAPLTEAQVAAMAPEEVNDRLDALMAQKGYQDNPDFKLLDQRMIELEDEGADVIDIVDDVMTKTSPAKKQEVTPTTPETSQAGTEATAQENADVQDQTVTRGAEPAVIAQPTAEPATRDEADPQPEPVDDSLGSDLAEPDSGEQADSSAAPKSVAQAYPNLLDFGADTNAFGNVFKLSAKRPSLFTGTGSPIQAIRDALASNEGFAAFTKNDGSKLKRAVDSDLAQFYQEDVLTIAENISAKVYEQLDAALDGSNGKMAIQPDLDAGKPSMDMIRGKALALLEKTPTGYTYNQELIEAAVLAGVNWMLSSKDTSNIKEEADVANIMGIEEGEVTPQLMAAFAGSKMTLLDVIPAMARQITSFWGVTPNKNFDQSATVGVPYGVATEILEAMVSLGYLNQDKLPALEGSKKTPLVFDLNTDRLNDAYLEYPTLLADMLEVEVPEALYFNGDIPPVNTLQMNSEDVKLTKQQQDMVKAEAATPFKLHTPMHDLMFNAMGKEMILDIFGAGELNEAAFNKNDFESASGKNLAIAAAYDLYDNRVKHMKAIADEQGIPLRDLEVRYNYGISSVGRAQMLGSYNPQASKLVREMMVPNRVTIDLTDPKMKQLHRLALAQMVGIKIHTMPFADSSKKLDDFISKNQATISALAQWLETGEKSSDFDAVLKAGVKAADSTFMGLHALLDLARVDTASDLTAFETAAYVEADGVTNGPANAIMNMTSGPFTQEWVENAGKGGLNFLGMSMNDYRSVDNVDLYETSTINAAKHRETLMKELEVQGLTKYGNDMAKLLSLFSKDIKVAEDDKGNVNVTMTRGAAKNPLTITVYGSGVAGIASKQASTLMEAIYKEMTAAQKRLLANPKLSPAEAMFGHKALDKADAERQFREFGRLMNQFTGEVVRRNKDNELVKRGASKKVSKIIKGKVETSFKNLQGVPLQALTNFQEFTLPNDLLEVLTTNVQTLHVDYMRAGIEDTLGHNLMNTVDAVQNLTQLQSMALALDFQQTVSSLVQERAAAAKAEGKRIARFISSDEQRKIMSDLMKKYPMVKNQGQQFLVAKTSRTVQGVSDFSRSLTEKYDMSAAVFAPDAAGVKGVPSLNIGMGDGLMMQLMSTMPDAVQGTLKIFDGVNLPIDQIEKGSLQANTAVHQTWQGNIMSDVMRAFDAAHPAVVEMLKSDIALGSKSRFAQSYKMMGIESAADLVAYINGMQYAGHTYAKQIQARHNALQRVNVTVDQMASADQPFRQDGGIDLSQMEPEEAATALNDLYKEELAKLETRQESVAEIKSMLKDSTQPLVSYTADGLLMEARKFPADLYETVKTALRSPAMREYTIHMGTPEQMNTKSGGLVGSSNGITDTANKRIYIASMEPEVIAHELVHAATYNNVEAAVNGTSKDTVVIESVDRLRALRTQFEEYVQSEALLDTTPEQMLSIRNMVNSMSQAETLYGEAAALNEFMAWNTTNQDLIDLGKTQQVKGEALRNFARKAIILLRRIFFGSNPDKLPKDFFNHVRFNTVLIASRREQPLDARMEAAVLNHSTAYGNDQRLADVQQGYAKAMAPILSGMQGMLAKTRMAQQAATLTTQVVADFPMTGQAASTFRTVVGTMMTNANLNPSSMARAQELYGASIKAMSVETFMKDSLANDPADRAQAESKYNLLVGKKKQVFDDQGRSSLLPVFIALATTDDGFRAILNKLELEKAQRYEGNTLDERIRNLGIGLMESMTSQLSGAPKTGTIRDAIDALNEHITAVVAEKESALAPVAMAVSGFMDKGNDMMLEGIERLSDKGIELSNKMRAAGWGKSAEVTELVSNLMVSDKAEQVSEFGISLMNKIKGQDTLRSLVNDIIGRVGSNANIYDMIKKVRSHVAAVRQEFRENVPDRLAEEFTTKPTEEQWHAMTSVMMKTDVAALNLSWKGIEKLLTSQAEMNKAVKSAEDKIKAVAGKDSDQFLAKAKQLAHFMNTGKPGTMLLRNPEAIASMLGLGTNVQSTPSFVKAIDQLTSLYALDSVDKAQVKALEPLFGDKGMSFMHSYIKQQAIDEREAALDGLGSKHNYYKGYTPTVLGGAESVIVADDARFSELALKSYVRIGDYNGAGVGKTKKGYYFSQTAARAPFQQGIIQNVTMTAGGVGRDLGFSQTLLAGVITDPTEVAAAFDAIKNGYEKGDVENLMPVFDEDGSLFGFERSVDPAMLEKLTTDKRAHMLAGAWRGRQVEESLAGAVNTQLLYNLKDMYDSDTPSRKASEYVNVFDLKDTVARDAMKLVPAYVLNQMKTLSGNTKEFMVRRDVLQDVLGYRSATIGDAWTGNTRWSTETQKFVRNAAISLAGNDAYRHLVNAESTLINYMGQARLAIAIKSVIVPVGNIMSNMVQLIMKGVPVKAATMDGVKYAAELDSYVKNRLRQVDAEAELRAAKNTRERQKLTSEIQSLKDAQKRLSIWPLLEAGEFTAISDVGLNHEDTKLTQGKWMDFIEAQIDKLPDGVRNAGRYALITQDTALFQGLQKMVQYGDFIAKATLYHDLVGRRGMTPEQAMAQITEEFVNYDRLPGRFRGTLENLGLLWFYNFKLRIMKVAARLLRDNPFHSLVASAVPYPSSLGIGTPIEDNALAKLIEGNLGYSIGPGMGLSAPTLNPWLNMAH